MSLPPTYKPSPLSIGSPRTSPFRRPESPGRPSTPTSSSNSRPGTPSTSPTKLHLTSPSKLQTSSTPPPAPSSSDTTPRNGGSMFSPSSPSGQSTFSDSTILPTKPRANAPATATTNATTSRTTNFSSLPPQILNSLRSAFSTLDRSSTGSISRTDVAATLADLGLPSSASDVSTYFPPGAPQTLSLAQFLGQLAGPLGQFSQEEELVNAFGAFDEKDCGEIDKDLLRDALIHTGGVGGETMRDVDIDQILEGFVGKKTFSKDQGMRGEVFRYRKWMDEVLGKGHEEGQIAGKA